jgi:hypothetical protein
MTHVITVELVDWIIHNYNTDYCKNNIEQKQMETYLEQNKTKQFNSVISETDYSIL